MKKILTASQTKDWDAYTIANEPISSLDLMERASQAFTHRFVQFWEVGTPIYIFAGLGNNGGDGLAIARLLHQMLDTPIHLYIARFSDHSSEDFKSNEERLPFPSNNIFGEAGFPEIPANAWVIDALFGSGLSRPIEGWLAKLIHHINASNSTIVAVDIASGLHGDKRSVGEAIIQPQHTLTFDSPKLTMMLPEYSPYVGHWEALPIGLSPEGIQKSITSYFYTDEGRIQELLKPRLKFSHKGTFGHVLLVAGSYGKMGAAYLAAKATLRSGAGLVSVHLPKCGYQMMQIVLPEAMCSIDPAEQVVSQAPDVVQYSAIAVGPGIGQAVDTRQAFAKMLNACKKHRKPLVIDADAINMIGSFPELLEQLPLHCIFTPHPKEFERLVGQSDNHFDRLALLQAFCKQYEVIVVLKGAHTAVGLPNGEVHFNSTGNPGMATAGAGDVLAGVISAFLAQGYAPAHAAILGTYLHGLSGDIAAEERSQSSMIASDLIESLGKAFLTLTPTTLNRASK